MSWQELLPPAGAELQAYAPLLEAVQHSLYLAADSDYNRLHNQWLDFLEDCDAHARQQLSRLIRHQLAAPEQLIVHAQAAAGQNGAEALQQARAALNQCQADQSERAALLKTQQTLQARYQSLQAQQQALSAPTSEPPAADPVNFGPPWNIQTLREAHQQLKANQADLASWQALASALAQCCAQEAPDLPATASLDAAYARVLLPPLRLNLNALLPAAALPEPLQAPWQQFVATLAADSDGLWLPETVQRALETLQQILHKLQVLPETLKERQQTLQTQQQIQQRLQALLEALEALYAD